MLYIFVQLRGLGNRETPVVTANNRAVVTGVGILAPNGVGAEVFWETLCAKQSGIGSITSFDSSEYSTRIAGEIKHFDPREYINGGFNPKRLARHSQLGLVATQMAIQDAKLDKSMLEEIAPVPIVTGVGISALDIIEQQVNVLNSGGPRRVGPVVGSIAPQAVASAISSYVGVSTVNQTISTACTAGLDAVGVAVAMVKSGRADLVIAGAADAGVTPFLLATFCTSRLLSKRNEDPLRASRPFDLHRDGGLLAEGAGMLIIENMEHALGRGATPYMEISGMGSMSDPADSQPAAGLKQSMTAAMSNAGCRPEHIDHISAHGPSDPLLDRVETAMIKETFGEQAYNIPVTSIKGATGNPFAAAGVFQLVASALTVSKGIIPPTANLESPDPDCDLDYVPDEARRVTVNKALINSHGVGGSNTTLVVEKVI